jgi:glutathione S-transferase
MQSTFAFVIILFSPSCCLSFSQRRHRSGLKDSVFDLLSARKVIGSSAVPNLSAFREGRSQLNFTSSTKAMRFTAKPEQYPNLVSASLPALLRAGSGSFAQNYTVSVVPRNQEKYSWIAFRGWQLAESGLYRVPREPIILYDVESCPHCRIVRETCSMLSLSATFRPLPRGGRRYEKEMKARFGAAVSLPVMLDPNTSVTLFDAVDIVRYLFSVYGSKELPWTVQNMDFARISSGIGVSLLRFGAGGTYRNSKPPPDEKPLVLWAYEGSPFCKVVREKLSELEVPHTVVFTPRGSPNRQKMFEMKGFFQVPYLEDPNTSTSLYDSEAIIEYLVKQYAVPASPVDYI